jgi:chloramphenicol O-acetyltransferase type A
MLIGRPDGTFGFSLIEYNLSFDIVATALAEIERFKQPRAFTRSFESDNVIHFRRFLA